MLLKNVLQPAILPPIKDYLMYGNNDAVPQLWTPAQIPRLFELDATNQPNGNVVQVNDTSGNDNHAEQTTASLQGVSGIADINGNNVIRFNEGLLSLTTQLTNVRSAIFVVANPDGANRSPGFTPLFGEKSDVGSIDYTFLRANTNDNDYDISIDGNIGRTGRVSFNGNPFVSGTNINYGNTNAQNEAPNLIYIEFDADVTVGQICGWADEAFWAARIDLAYSAFLSNTLAPSDLEKYQGFAGHYWGLLPSFPNNHPYKINPPTV